MDIVKRMIRVGSIACVLSTMFFSAGYSIGVQPPPAKYTEQEYNKAVDALAAQNISRPYNRKTTAYLACFLGWAGGENFYLRQYIRFGIFISIAGSTIGAAWIPSGVNQAALILPAAVGVYSVINGRAYFAMSDQQFDELRNPEFYGQVEQIIKSKREEGSREVAKLNKILSDCRALYEAGDYDKALTACQSAKSESDVSTDKNLKSRMCELMGHIYESLGDHLSARKEYAKAISNAQAPEAKANLKQDFKRTEDTFVKVFLKEGYDKRKLIMPVDNMEKMEFSEHINVLDIKNLPDIEFRNGSPAINQLYVGHPYINEQYIPLKDSQYEFLRDRIGEYFELMQALGATRVDIKSITINKQEYGLEASTETGGSLSADPAKVVEKLGPLSAIISKVLPKEKVTVGATRKKQESKSISESDFHGLKIKQVFYPKKKPFLPKGLTWYKHEPSWQRLYRQRLQGDLLQHTEKVSTTNNKLIQDSELSQIAGELGILLGGIETNQDKTTKQTIGIQEDVELTIDVKFAPLDALK